MKLYILTLVILLSFISCSDEKSSNEIARDNLSIVLLAIGRDLFKANYCEPPQLILEEGKTYNITLEEGKRFWFNFAVNSDDNKFVNKKIRLTINNSPGTTFDLDSINCSYSFNESGPFVVPKFKTSTQVIYELGIQRSNVYSTLKILNGDPNLSLNIVLFSTIL